MEFKKKLDFRFFLEKKLDLQFPLMEVRKKLDLQSPSMKVKKKLDLQFFLGNKFDL